MSSTTTNTVPQEARALLTLGLPLVGSNVAGFLIHMTDTIILGWYDVISLAAGVLATSLFFNVFILGAGFGNAVLPIAASAIAAGDHTRARRVTRMALWLSVLYAALAVVALWWSEAIFLAIGQRPEVAVEAQAFMRIAVWGMFPALAGNVFRSYLGAHHLTGVVLWVTMTAVVVNLVVNYVLVFGNWGAPEMGIRGSALASVAVQTVSMLALGAYAHFRLPEGRLFQRLWKPDWSAMAQVTRIGLPIGTTSLFEAGLFMASAIMMGWIGAVELAAHGIALQLAALTFMFHIGISQAATIRAGGAFGRRNEPELRRVAKTAIAISMCFAALVVTVFVSLNEQLVSIFIDPTEPQRALLLTVGSTLVLLAALFQFADALQVAALSLLRGVQDTTVPMWLAGISYWLIGLPASYLFAFVWGMNEVGLWLGLTSGLASAATLLMWRFWRRSVRIAVQAV